MVCAPERGERPGRLGDRRRAGGARWRRGSRARRPGSHCAVVARSARFVLPAPVANAVVAAAGTWALAKAAKAYGDARFLVARSSAVRPDLVLGCARPSHGRDDAEHRAGRGAPSARRGRCLVRVPGVDAGPDRRRGTPSSSRGPGRASPSACAPFAPACAASARSCLSSTSRAVTRVPGHARRSTASLSTQVVSTMVLNPRSARPE